MRQIGTIPSESDAIRFSDYLLTIGIPNQVEYSESSGAWDVWVENDDHLDRATAELASFNANPSDSRYTTAGRAAKAVRTDQVKAEERRRKNFIDYRTRSATPHQWNVPVTLFLITAAVIVAVLTKVGQDQQNPTSEALWFSGVQQYVTTSDGHSYPLFKPASTTILKEKQVWRLVTPIFLHFGILHLVFNLFWIRDLGAMIESRKGTLFMLLLVLVVAVTSNCGEYIFENRLRFTPFVFANFGGLSGVVYGLFGYAWARGRIDPSAGVGVRTETVAIMIVWLFACMTGFIGSVANTAHVVGLLVGLAFGYVPYAVRKLLR